MPVLWARRRRTCFLIVNFARLLLTGATDCAIMIWSRGVAQLGSALGSGPRGRRFESCHSDHIRIIRTLSEWERCSDFLFLSNIRISMQRNRRSPCGRWNIHGGGMSTVRKGFGYADCSAGVFFSFRSSRLAFHSSYSRLPSSDSKKAAIAG